MDPMLINKWGRKGTRNEEFYYPVDIAVGNNGIIYVADSWNNRIQCFTSEGKFIYKWGKSGRHDGEFFTPSGLAISDGLKSGINKSVTNAMKLVPELALFPPGLLPMCVSYIGMECIYVVDSDNYRIQVFDVTNLQHPEKGGKLTGSTNYSINSCDSDTYSIDGFANSVVTGEENVRFIRKWGSRGKGNGQFMSPCNCAIGKSVIYVLDRYNHSIQLFDSEGKFIHKFDNASIGQIWDPYKISIIHGFFPSMACDKFTSSLTSSSISEPQGVIPLSESANSDALEQNSEPQGVIGVLPLSELMCISGYDNNLLLCYRIDISNDLNKVKIIHQWTHRCKGHPMSIMKNIMNEINIMCITDDGNSFITQYSVDEFNSVRLIGTYGSDEVMYPSSIATRDNVLYITDTNNHRVVVMKMYKC